MRWMDLPADRGSADAGASALARREWDDLRRRLEQLPLGHPSRVDGEGRADQEAAGEGGVDRTADGEGLAYEATAGQGGADEPRGGPDPDPEGGRSGSHGDFRERHAGDTGPARPGGPGDLGGLGRGEPYRPWFTAGESPEPWFAADPG
jgi:hypothetical protein